jgi:hypothetical protein
MSVKQLPLPGAIIKKSNVLARAAWSPDSIWETRLIALVAARIRVDDVDFMDYEIPVAELLQQHGGGRDYQELMIGIDRVMSRVVTIKEADGWTKYNIFSKCQYLIGFGVVRVSFHPDLKPHFLNLKERFVQYSLMEYLMLPSVYSQRIFEILMTWKGCAEYEIMVDDLHEMLGTPEAYRKDFNILKCRILEKAHGDINKKTMLRYEWEPVKKGRKIVAVRFIFDMKKVMHKRKQLEQTQQQEIKDKNNKNGLDAVACFAEKGVCECPTNKKMICQACKTMGITE